MSAWYMRVWMPSRSCPSRILNNGPGPLVQPDSSLSCSLLHTIMQAAIKDVKRKFALKKICPKNTAYNNLLFTRGLSAVDGSVSQMAGSDGAVAQRLSPQGVTQHELTPANFPPAGPTSLCRAAARRLG